MPDQRDIPDKGAMTDEMHQMERIFELMELMEIQEDNEKILSYLSENNQGKERAPAQTVATNTTK